MIYKLDMIPKEPISSAVQKELTAIVDNKKENDKMDKGNRFYRIANVVAWRLGKKVFNFNLYLDYK